MQLQRQASATICQNVFLCREPQNPAAGSFLDCFHSSGLATTHVKGHGDARLFTQEAANLLLDIHNAEGTSLSLLAVTLMNENTTFDLKLGPNTNRSKNTEWWDVGPFGVNQHYTNIAIKKGAESRFSGKSYSHAMAAWQNHYAYYVIKGGGYRNEVEAWAKSRRDQIMDSLQNDPKSKARLLNNCK